MAGNQSEVSIGTMLWRECEWEKKKQRSWMTLQLEAITSSVTLLTVCYIPLSSKKGQKWQTAKKIKRRWVLGKSCEESKREAEWRCSCSGNYIWHSNNWIAVQLIVQWTFCSVALICSRETTTEPTVAAVRSACQSDTAILSNGVAPTNTCSVSQFQCRVWK